MPLTAGTRLGAYEIVAAIGAGGMGEVYKARDTRLKRDVAIKVLPEAFSHDPDRLARFQREAEVLATLNHPNIAAIYGLEHSNGIHAIVMELVEGETLAQRLAGDRGPGPRGPGLVTDVADVGRIHSDPPEQVSPILVTEALSIARQVADALQAAHEKGIVHRDLKPANIAFTLEGQVKVLDFGLAKALEGEARHDVTNSPTLSLAATQVGVILGTAAYMSPEQAKGRPADKRSDVWAFGAVLYEMVTGRRAFQGDDLSDMLATVLKSDPDFNVLPADVPPHIRMLVQRCLAKDRRQRMADISVALFIMNDAASLPPAAVAAGGEQATGVRPPLWRRIMVPTAAAITVGAAVGTAVWFISRPVPPLVNRWTVAPSGTAALALSGVNRDLTITPDGRRLVYVGSNGNQLFVRALDQLDPLPLGGLGLNGAASPFASPDGQWIGFFDNVNNLKRVAITGGPAVLIGRADSGSRGAAWGADGTIVFATNSGATGLRRVSATGGEPTVLTRPSRERGETDHVFPEFLPGGRAVLFTITTTGGIDNAQIAVLDLSTGTQKVLVRGGSHAHYVRTGHLVYGAGGALRAVGFNLDRLETFGTPTPVVPQVLTTPFGAADFVVAGDGTLAYVTGGLQGLAQRSLVWVDRQGREEPIKAAPARTYTYPRISPDGKQVALDIRDQASDIWIWDLEREALRRLTFDPGIDSIPAWTPDGRRLIFASQAASGTRELFWQSADGTGTPERLTQSMNTQSVTSVTSDGTRAVFYETGASRDMMLLTLDKERRVQPLFGTPSDERNGELSPDGRWLAYDSNESGTFEVSVRPFPDVNSGRWQVSSGGGSRPLWNRSGQELYFLGPTGALMSVQVNRGAAWSAGVPTKLFEGPYFAGGAGLTARTYDVSPDGRRFLMLKPLESTGQAPAPSIVVVENWLEELRRLVPTGK